MVANSSSTLSISGSKSGAGFRLESKLHLNQPLSEVFNFFADAENLETITPDWLRFRIESQLPIEMHVGTEIEYRLKIHAIPVRWRSRISEWSPPYRFVDEQLSGPYRFWHHLHTFEESYGGTLIRDVVHYDVPLRFVLHPLFIRADLMKIFQYRTDAIFRHFNAVTDRLDV